MHERDGGNSVTVLLVDGYNLLYRAFTSLPLAIVGADGRPINGVFGLFSSIVRLVRELEVERVAVAFDVPAVPTFRRDLYAGYQAQRGPLGGEQAEEFERQAEIARRALPLLGAPAISVPGFEADDVLGTLANQATQIGRHAVIATTDRDLLQLVRPGIEIATPGKVIQRARTAQDVITRMGVPPEGIPTLKALAGDPSDNIPGVRGIGVKTAVDLVNRFRTLDEIFARVQSLAPRVATALTLQAKNAYLFLDIVTVRTDLDLPIAMKDIGLHGFSADAGIRQLLDLVLGDPPRVD
jgi:DNA polymerase-1